MKLYLVRYSSPHDGERWRWCGSKAAADREAASLGEHEELMEIEQVDVPEQKQPLIAWLNRHATDNNG